MEEQSDSNKAASQPAVLQATIHITRKATGKVETYHLTSEPVKDEPKKEAP